MQEDYNNTVYNESYKSNKSEGGQQRKETALELMDAAPNTNIKYE